MHVLNRAGFGPRPGDVAHVRQIGLEVWIEQQLQPERIPDAAVEARLRSYETLDLSSGEIAQRYFLPAKRAKKARKAEQGKRAEQGSQGRAKQAGRAGASAYVGPNFSSAGTSTEAIAPEMKRARQVLVELSAQKIVRAVYSDRQLEEVLTDFWFNHFNVYAGKGLTRVCVTEYEREAIRPHVLGQLPRSAGRDREESGDALLPGQLHELLRQALHMARRRGREGALRAARASLPRARASTKTTRAS